MTDSGASVDAVVEHFGELMRELHLARSTRGVPWVDCPFTLPQLRALSLLAAREQGLSGRELAALLGITPSAITPLMDRLVEHGLVRREEDRLDRRITRLIVTPAGVASLERMLAGRSEHLREVLAHLRAEDLATVDRAFAILRDGLRRITAPAGSGPAGPAGAVSAASSA